MISTEELERLVRDPFDNRYDLARELIAARKVVGWAKMHSFSPSDTSRRELVEALAAYDATTGAGE